ncbi:hypothetical protein [Corynebacterium sp. UBA2622]|uniref:hypothetical protein n=1 Tax=Corynebacterium sp. UBA2622 TaxID=1946393 RepID=UPI0025BB696B|nr:hypothetical protein [Corynebacterium sp. UBA2622]
MSPRTNISRSANPAPGPEPRGVPAVRWLTVVIGLGLLGLAGLVGRDVWFRYGAKQPGDSWVASALQRAAAYSAELVPAIVGIAAAVAGLVLVVAALSPRPRTHVRFDSPASIWLRPVDIARKATYTAREVTAAHNIRSQATRSKLRVQLQDDGSGDMLSGRLRSALADEMAGLYRPPRIDVRLTPQPAPTEEATA